MNHCIKTYLRWCATLLLSALLAACAGTSGSAAGQPAPAPAAPAPAVVSAHGRTSEGYAFRGAADAPIVMQDFSDFLCTECHAFATETEPAITAAYIATGKVKFVFRHLLQLGPGSVRTAEASECAGAQDQFWPMHDTLYARQGDVYASKDLDATLLGFASDLKLDTAAFGACMQNHTYLQAVQADDQAAQLAGVHGRPAFDINGARLIGAQPFRVFQQAIDAALAK